MFTWIKSFGTYFTFVKPSFSAYFTFFFWYILGPKNGRNPKSRPSQLILRDSVVPDSSDHGYASNEGTPPPPFSPPPAVTGNPEEYFAYDMSEEVVDHGQPVEEEPMDVDPVNLEPDFSQWSRDDLVKELVKERRKNAIFRAGLAKILNPDSIEVLLGEKLKQNNWSFATIELALEIRYTVGFSGYELLLEKGWPLPSVRTLNRRLECMPYQPGIIQENFDILEQQVKDLSPNERKCILSYDEAAIQAMIEMDRSTQRITGFATIPLSSSSRSVSKKKGIYFRKLKDYPTRF